MARHNILVETMIINFYLRISLKTLNFLLTERLP